MTRRSALKTAAASLAASAIKAADAPPKGRLKQSAARWCYQKMEIEELCRNGAEIGLSGIDLVKPEEWATVQKYGLVPSMVYSAGTIPDGWNRLENHDRLVKEMQTGIQRAAAAKLPNVITFSGNRRGQPDEEGKENCIIGLRKVSKMAEDNNVTICLELLNSKVNHHDYQCDHTAWGVAVMKGVDSPRVKLLYDIYHMQIMEGDIIRTIRENIQYIGHFHTGGVPGRHELDETQELQWRAIATAIADLNFTGFFAHEFEPTRDPMASLRQAVALCTV
ncbi:MAG: sugar phosphate isomerase/epimerase [Acidobacteriaceae bacterium]|nr:sugar phosphate isomerase/epimerase [Acidobacteriaceae bacterium]